MLHLSRWKVVLILLVCVLGMVYTAPNLMSEAARGKLSQIVPFAPTKTVSLGLDLRGGAHLLLQADIDAVLHDRAEGMLSEIRTALRKEGVGYTRLTAVDKGVSIVAKDVADIEQIRKIAGESEEGLTVSLVGADTVEAVFGDVALKQIRDLTLGQAIETVRRRVDETGTREPVIQRHGQDRILLQIPGLDDPKRIKDLLGKTAKLSFHLVGMGEGAVKTLPMVADPEHPDAPRQTLPIQRRAILTGDMLVNAQPAFQDGGPVVSFKLNSVGAKRFCDVTRENVDKPFAIVLDEEIISAPRINGPICGGSAVITGNFSVQETNDLSILLRAGALPAPLTVLEERSVGPTLGADSVEAGKIAGLVALAFVVTIALLSYGLFGVFSSLALLINMVLIFALLSGLQATLTLPGIAGIVLTMGMAVDANVLIFERMREEMRLGRSVLAAVDAGYTKAMTSIIDSNLSTLISAAILYSFGTGPIKGFAVTLAIGVVTSMFSAIMLTRLMVVSWVKRYRPQQLPI